MGVEPTGRRSRDGPPVLKTGPVTGPAAPPACPTRYAWAHHAAAGGALICKRMLPFEFTVEGPPVSYQTRVRLRLRAWEDKVAHAAKVWLPAGASPIASGRLKITLVYYHERPSVNIDNDNLLKPVQDALKGIVYRDDVLITDADVRKKNLDGFYRVRGMSPVLAAAFVADTEFLFVRIEEAPNRGDLL
jgi:crossover junction endodeoxyribonuclease RusA